MKVIHNQKRSKVYFDPVKDVFIKYFFPKWNNRLKYFLRFRKYPGNNFFFIATELKKLNLNVPEILNFSHYSITMKNIHGVSLDEYLKNDYSKEILNDFINIVVCILSNNIYSGDMGYGNFLIKNNKIYIVDLEDYRKVKFFKRDNSEAIRRMKGKVDDWVIEEIKRKLNLS